jgi:hypothetical protein
MAVKRPLHSQFLDVLPFAAGGRGDAETPIGLGPSCVLAAYFPLLGGLGLRSDSTHEFDLLFLVWKREWRSAVFDETPLLSVPRLLLVYLGFRLGSGCFGDHARALDRALAAGDLLGLVAAFLPLFAAFGARA